MNCITDAECPPGTVCESITGECVPANDPFPPVPGPLPPASTCTQASINSTKNISAVVSAVAFGVISSPMVYRLTNQIFAPLGLATSDQDGCPTTLGLLVHGIVYTVVVRLTMDHLPKCDPRPGSSKDKWITSAMGGALFILVSSPMAYQITNSLVTAIAGSNNNIADADGCPRLSGLVIHTIVFGGIVRLLMK